VSKSLTLLTMGGIEDRGPYKSKISLTFALNSSSPIILKSFSYFQMIDFNLLPC